MLKNTLKLLLPPIVMELVNLVRAKPKSLMWTGNYDSWDAATGDSSGYDQKTIIEKVRDSAIKVKDGEVAYERDGVTFDRIQYAWPVAAVLQHAALQQGFLEVLDFGGSLGTSYFQNKAFLDLISKVQWNIVEQSEFVKIGKSLFETNNLKFLYTIDEYDAKPNVILLSGVLQYLSQPYSTISELIKLESPYIIIDKTTFNESDEDVLTIQHTPKAIYEASYPAWFLGLKKVLSAFSNYETVDIYNTYEGISVGLENGKIGSYKGIILKLKRDD